MSVNRFEPHTNPEPTRSVELADSDLNMLLFVIDYAMVNCADLTIEEKQCLDYLGQHLERQGEN